MTDASSEEILFEVDTPFFGFSGAYNCELLGG